MNREKLEAAGIDYDVAVERFAGRDDLYEKYLTRFSTDTHMENATRYFGEQDYNHVLEEVHALKGITGTLGMEQLYHACQEVVDNIRQDQINLLPDSLQAVQKEYNKVMKYFDK